MKKITDILAEIRPEADFEKSEDFIGDGLMDSFDLITFVAALDEEYGVKIKGTEIVPENFMNIPAIGALLERYGVKK